MNDWQSASILQKLFRNHKRLLPNTHNRTIKYPNRHIHSKRMVSTIGRCTNNSYFDMTVSPVCYKSSLGHLCWFTSNIHVRVIFMYSIMSMGYCKEIVNPLLTHWSSVFLASTHRFISKRGLCQNSVHLKRNLLVSTGADGNVGIEIYIQQDKNSLSQPPGKSVIDDILAI